MMTEGLPVMRASLDGEEATTMLLSAARSDIADNFMIR